MSEAKRPGNITVKGIAFRTARDANTWDTGVMVREAGAADRPPFGREGLTPEDLGNIRGWASRTIEWVRWCEEQKASGVPAPKDGRQV